MSRLFKRLGGSDDARVRTAIQAAQKLASDGDEDVQLWIRLRARSAKDARWFDADRLGTGDAKPPVLARARFAEQALVPGRRSALRRRWLRTAPAMAVLAVAMVYSGWLDSIAMEIPTPLDATRHISQVDVSAQLLTQAEAFSTEGESQHEGSLEHEPPIGQRPEKSHGRAPVSERRLQRGHASSGQFVGEAQGMATRSEHALVAGAQRVLRKRPRRALRLLQRHARLYRGGRLIQERELLRVEAELLLGRHQAARQRMAAFSRDFPHSKYTQRLDALARQLSNVDGEK